MAIWFHSLTFPSDELDIITPRDTASRGAQLSIRFRGDVSRVHARLQLRGVVCDLRDQVSRVHARRQLRGVVCDLRDQVSRVHAGLQLRGVVCDLRDQVPLYFSFCNGKLKWPSKGIKNSLKGSCSEKYTGMPLERLMHR